MKHELDADQLDRAAGVLTASAAGDALGAGYEFSIPADSAVISMIGGGPFGFDPGEWTDDTSMALAVAQAAAAHEDRQGLVGSHSSHRFIKPPGAEILMQFTD
ncbi:MULTISPECIES: ADP-ribosylglycohydrolase family protein [unclassified Rhodococcus (in: high G+C Gram-positive bacteria)]|uniref:ADP-ribosylglycohydrolase family protein n=1 Tax=unclassified Rhodococcus (in: high G+C Gram-positive bacteria) TaxID=192944 RepID=UPI0033932BDF